MYDPEKDEQIRRTNKNMYDDQLICMIRKRMNKSEGPTKSGSNTPGGPANSRCMYAFFSEFVVVYFFNGEQLFFTAQFSKF